MKTGMTRLCPYYADLKYELDELIEDFTKNNDRIWGCRGMINRTSIYMNDVTYQKLCREVGYMPEEIARYRGYSIEIDNYLENGQLMMREDDIVMNYLFRPCERVYGGIRSGKTFATFNPVPLRYIINKGATILFWADGDKTIVKRSKDDKFDKTKGFLWAYFLKHSGMSRSKANKFLENLEVEDK